MSEIPLEQGLLLSVMLFGLGLVGVLVRRDMLFILISLEVMMSACGLAFVMVGSRWGQADGQIVFILILALAAAETSVGLALLLRLHRRFHTLDIDMVSEMRG